MRAWLFLTSLAALSSAGGTAALADGLDAHRFVPAAGAGGELDVEHPALPFHLGLGAGLFLSFADDPVVERDLDSGAIVSRPLDSALSADLALSIGLFGRAEIGAHLPVHLYYDGDDAAGVSARPGPGDVRLVPKLRLVAAGDATTHVLVGASAPLSIPTGDASALRGADGVAVRPTLLAAAHTGPLGVIANAGYAWRSRHSETFAYADEISFGLSGLYDITPDLRGSVELVGGAQVRSDVDGADLPIEVGPSLAYQATDHVRLFAGARAGLSRGLGSPHYRALAGVRVTGRMPARNGLGDSDGDGVRDIDDRCPYTPGATERRGCPLEPVEPEREPRAQIVDGELILLDRVTFRLDSAEIRDETHPLLDDIAAAFESHPEIRRIRIEGHTDDTGTDQRNQELSEARAESVKSELIRRGIDPDRLETAGYGNTRPVDTNDTPEGRAKNRRVEFIILDRENAR